jgi:AcrR family transcriptional regulator
MTSRRVKPHPRTLPRQQRSTETVRAVLTAAAEAFARDGFAQANINAIAQRAGVSIGSLYRYYPSKEAVLVALIEQHTLETLETLERALASTEEQPLPEAIRGVVLAMVEAHRAPLHRMLARELDELGRLGELVATVDRRAGQAVQAFLASRAHQVRPLDVPLAAFLLVRAVDGLTHAGLLDRPELPAEALVDELTSMVLGYLTTPAAPRAP